MNRFACLALAGALLAGCYESHSGVPLPRGDGGTASCGAGACGPSQRCCELCDGETACVGTREPCPAVICDAECASNADCASLEYCAYELGTCGATPDSGQCQPRPTGCFADCPGACGCDEVTYCNRCEAARAGTSVAHDGPCETTGTPCGPGVCSPDAYCERGALCEDAPAPACAPIPTDCPTLLDPACGCDGLVYSNSCFAHVAGVSVTDPSRCETDLTTACASLCEFLEGVCGLGPMDCMFECTSNIADCSGEDLARVQSCAAAGDCASGLNCLTPIVCVSGE